MEEEKRKPIRSRILKVVLLIAALSLLVTSLFGILSMLGIQREAENALTTQAKDNLMDVIESKTALADERLKSYETIAFDLAYYVEEIIANPDRYSRLDLTSPEVYDTGDWAYSFALADDSNYNWDGLKGQAELLANVAQRFYPVAESYRNVIQAVYFGFDNGLLLSFDHDSEFVPPQLMYYDFLDTDWYAFGKSTDGIKFTEVYTDSFGRGLTVTCVCPLHDGSGNVVGVLGMDMGITELYEYILDLDLGEGISAFVADADGKPISPEPADGESSGEEGPPDLAASDKERMESFADGIVVRDNMYYAFSSIKSVDWKLCVRVPRSDVLELADSIGQDIVSSIIIFILFFLIILVTVVIVVYDFSEKITKPITDLTKDVGVISSGNLDHRATISGNDEISDLAGQFNEMAGSLKEHINSLTAVTAEKERISAELNVAAKIQADMMPKDFPQRDEFSMYALMTPAKEIGGDFYDFFMIDENRLALIMADVSGKGVPAALFMVIAKTLLKIRTTAPGTPAQMLWDINNTLCADDPAGLFVTAWFGILDISSGEIICANAGHEYPAIRHAGGDFELMVTEHCPPLATVENIEYFDEKYTMQPGDELFLYTDGVPEAKAANGLRFGTDMMLSVLNSGKGLPPEELLGKLKGELDSFAGDKDPFDDITMLDIVWNGKK